MAKQTMGFSGQALKFRTDVKAFHLQVCFCVFSNSSYPVIVHEFLCLVYIIYVVYLLSKPHASLGIDSLTLRAYFCILGFENCTRQLGFGWLLLQCRA
jgi:hypothetical protein